MKYTWLYFQELRTLQTTCSNPLYPKDMPSLGGFKHLLLLHPNKELNLLIKWLESSLRYDFVLIVTELVFNGEIKITLDSAQIKKEVIESIIEIGALSLLMNGGHLQRSENQLSENIKIRSAALALDRGMSERVTKEQLFHLLND